MKKWLLLLIIISVVSVSFAQDPDPCEGVVCSDGSTTCPDGTTVTCSNSCTDGQCSSCTPDCTGHDTINPCATIFCQESSIICPDGTTVTCPNSCTDGQCSSCTPDCTGHEVSVDCPVIDAEKPQCDQNEKIVEDFDGKGCVTGYKCESQISCPSKPEPPPCDGTLEGIYDDKGCVIDYTCKNIIIDCTQEYNPVCGMDGVTYSNECKAKTSGVGIDYYGECKDYTSECGNFICEKGETPENCHDDCQIPEGGCPVSKQCPDNSVVMCKETEFGCECDQCPIGKIPEGCSQEVDNMGYVRIVCDTKTVCEEIPQDTRLKCVEEGGTPVFRKDPSGCKIFDCQFGSGTNPIFNPMKNPIDKSPCPTHEDWERVSRKCKNMGLPVFMSIEGGCNIPKCGERPDRVCPEIENPEIREEIANKCKRDGMQVVKDYDPSGCPITRCGRDDFCREDLPEEAYRHCSEKSGELIVKKDRRGCVRFSECLRRGDERDAYVERPERMPDATDLLSLAFKMEKLKITFDKMSRKTNDIAEYYKQAGSSEEEKFRRVSDMFEAAKYKVDEIKDKMRDMVGRDDILEDDIIEIKRDVRYIKDVILKDILFLMLSTGDEIDEITSGDGENCMSDGECFDRAFRICKKVQFLPEGKRGPIVNIQGLEGDVCIMKARLPEGEGPPPGAIPGLNPPYEMTCKIKNYALGINDPEEILPDCEGSMVELMKKFGTGSGEGPGVPGKCSGDECKEYCSRGSEEAKECLEYLGPYIPPEAKESLTMLAEGRQPAFQKEGFDSRKYRKEFRDERDFGNYE